MSNNMKKIGLFGLIIISGFIIARMGQPYNSALFGLHKISVVVMIIWFVKYNIDYKKKNGELLKSFMMFIIIVLILLVSGAIMALTSNIELLRWTHRLVAYGVVIFVIIFTLKQKKLIKE